MRAVPRAVGPWLSLVLGQGTVCAVTTGHDTVCAHADGRAGSRHVGLGATSLGGDLLCGLEATDQSIRCVDLQTQQAFVPNPMRGLLGLLGGEDHTCALRNDRTVWCWGLNSFGQLGDGSLIDRPAPVRVHGLTDIEVLRVAHNHACALRSDRTVWCWGLNSFGQLGDGSIAARPTPSRAFGMDVLPVDVSTGPLQTCVLRSDRVVACWGDVSQSQPKVVVGLPEGVVQLVSGREFMCVRSEAGEVWCWGKVRWMGCDRCAVARPARVTGLDDAAWISASPEGEIACAIRAGGEIVCWGEDALGLRSERFWNPSFGHIR